MTFKNLGLAAPLLRAVDEEGYSQPTPIQEQAIPLILEGFDLMASAQTGTGKTAAFTLPLLHRMSERQPRKKQRPRALILTPTRELAAQINENVKTYGKYLPLKTAVIFGGASMNVQVQQLQRGVDILIATPGRLLDHASQRTVDFSQIETLVLDEADRMLDMGFIPDIRRIVSLLPKERQNLLFSATFSDEIKKLASAFLRSPRVVETTPRNTPAERVSHVVHPVDSSRKKELLAFLIASNDWQQVLVFTRTKHGANRVSDFLASNKIRSVAIHGNKTQAARTRALADFHKGAVRVLVATDIAARGIDIERLPHVVNFDLPHVPEDYIHRIGRTGRAGEKGSAVSLVCIDERQLLHGIERLLKMKIDRISIAAYEPDPSIPPQPIFKSRNQQPRYTRRDSGRSDGYRQNRGRPKSYN